MPTIRYMSEVVCDFNALVDKPFNLESPCRSTVPLLAYWADFTQRLAHFGQSLQLPIPADASLTFEYTVSPIRGRGKASHTDLLIQSAPLAIAEEAKYTEGNYDAVSTWCGSPPSRNKVDVLEGWLEMINRVTGGQLVARQVQSIAYQLIHRTASACSINADRRAVVYHYFDPTDRKREYYRKQLRAFADLFAAPKRVSFYLYETPLVKTAAYVQLQARWLRNKKQDFSDDVRRLLKCRDVATFGEPVVTRF